MAGAATVTGHYVDVTGMRLGDLFSGTIDSTAVTGWADVLAIPTDAVGVVFDLSADIRYETVPNDGTESDLADLQAMGPTIPAGVNIAMGRVR